MKNIRRVILSTTLVSLFVSYYVGGVFFSHTHYLGATKITHSHPYCPSANHTHTACGFNLVSSLSDLTFIIIGANASLFAVSASEFIFDTSIIEPINSLTPTYCQLRAPPVC